MNVFLKTLVFGLTIYANNISRVNAPGKDENVVIKNKVEKYQFTFGDKNAPVVVNQEDMVTYQCNDFRTSIGYAEFYDAQSAITSIKARVNGKKFGVKPVHQAYSVDGFFYSDAKVCLFELPLNEKGSESSVELSKVIYDPRYLTSIYFSEGYFTKVKQIVLVIPSWMHVDIKEMNFDKGKITKSVQRDSKNDSKIITYTAKNVKARTSEAYAPGPSYIYPHLLICSQFAETKDGKVNYFNSTDDQYAWYRSLVKMMKSGDPSVAEAAKKITAGANSPTEKAKKVLNWVQDNIRYIAFEDGIAGFKPDNAHDVLSKKYGDCKGMANLTKELLSASGLDARLCWIGTNHIAYDYSIPSLAVDNHMICAVKIDGKFHFLDGTESYIGFDQYAERIQGRQVMIEDGDHYILEHIPLRTLEQNRVIEKRQLAIKGNDIVGTVNLEYTGEAMESLLTGIHSTEKQDTEKSLTEFLSESDKKCEIKQLKTSNLKDWNQDLTINYDVKHQDAVTQFDKEMYLEIDFRKEFKNLIIDTTKRETDFIFNFKRILIHETSLELPPGYQVQNTPAPVNIDRDQYSFVSVYKSSGNQLIYTKCIKIKDTHLPLSAMKQWNADLKQLTDQYNNQVTLVKK